MASRWRWDSVRMQQDGVGQALEVCQGSGVGVRKPSRCVRMRQKSFRGASGRRQNNFHVSKASG